MKVAYGSGTSKHGPGINIELTGDEVTTAVDAWLVSHGCCVRGPRTITINGELCKEGWVYVGPSGFVVYEGNRISGDGKS